MTPAVKLTRDRVEALKPKTGRYEVRDAVLPGLRVIVQPTGSKSWAFRFNLPRQPVEKFTLGPYPAVTLEAARVAAGEARARVVAGISPAADKATARAPANSVLAAFKAYDAGYLSRGRPYLDHEADPKTTKPTPAEKDDKGNVVEPKIGEATAAGTRSFFVRRVLPVWGSRPVGSITRQDVVVLLDTLDRFKDARRKGKTRLSHFFGWTMDRNALVTANPAAGAQATTPPSRKRVLTDDELRAIWNACDQVGTFGAMVRTLILTLARRSEVAEMPRAELSESLWSIDGSRTKNGRPMDIHRTTQLNAVLAGVPRIVRDGLESPFVFEGRRHNRPLGGFSDLKMKLDAITGDAVAPWTLHDLRRTGTTLMQQLKIPFEVREACLNHTIKGVSGVYNRHDYAAEKRKAFEALAAKVLRIVAGKEVSNVVPMTRPMA